MIRFIERKFDGDNFVGYLVEHDGMQMVLSQRDLYEQLMMEDAIESGYKYHDYYGNIESADGININELSKSQLTPFDNTTVLGQLEDEALPESKAVRYFTQDMSKIQTVEFRDPVDIKIHTRDELVSYLRNFKMPGLNRVTDYDFMPLNAICAREALFTVEEAESSYDVKVLLGYAANRRIFPTIETVKLLQDRFIELGVLKEEDRDNFDMFINAYFAWGPEGIKGSCIDRKMEYDVIYSIGTPYTGTGREKLTYDSVRARIKSDITTDILSQINFDLVYGVMDRDGSVTTSTAKVRRDEIIEHEGDILFSQRDMKGYQTVFRDMPNWKGKYNVCKSIQVKHMNRFVLTMQTEDGRFFEYRVDANNVDLVSMQGPIIAGSFAKIKGTYGETLNLSMIYDRKDFEQYAIFHKIAYGVIDKMKVAPAYTSTSELCMNNGLHAENTLDYIQIKSGGISASSFLHNDIDKAFIDKFTTPGVNPDELPYYDLLDMLLANYTEALNTEDAEKHYNFEEVLANSLGSSPADISLAIYIHNERPDLKIASILNFGKDDVSLKQKAGRENDILAANEKCVYGLLRTLYQMEYGDDTDSNKLADFIEKIHNEEFCQLSEIVPELKHEAIGCLQDYVGLKYSQLLETDRAIWVQAVIGEFSCAPVEERRHLAFIGTAMNLTKGTVLRKIITRNVENAVLAVNSTALIGDAVRFTAKAAVMSDFLDFLWGVRFKTISLEQIDGKYVKHYNIKDPMYGFDITMDYEITDSEYYYITNPACVEFSYVYDTLSSFCRHSVIAQYTTFKFDSVLSNVIMSPWRVTNKRGYAAVPVYTGATNLIDAYTWNTFYKEKMPDLYNQVETSRGRLYLGKDANGFMSTIYDGTNGVEKLYPLDTDSEYIANTEFRNANVRLGINSTALPASMSNYYLDNDNLDESIRRYMERVLNTTREINSKLKGNKLYKLPLKSDSYYEKSAAFYGEEPVTDFETVPSDYPIKATHPFGPVLTGDTAMTKIETGAVKVYDAEVANITVDDMLRCTNLIKDGFSPKANCYVGTGTIYLYDGTDTTYGINTLTIDTLVTLATNGYCYQLNRNMFMFYALNGTYVLEVA